MRLPTQLLRLRRDIEVAVASVRRPSGRWTSTGYGEFLRFEEPRPGSGHVTVLVDYSVVNEGTERAPRPAACVARGGGIVRPVVPSDSLIVLVTSSSRLFHPRHYHLLARGLHEAGLEVVVVGQPDPHGQAQADVPVRLLPRKRNRLRRMLSGPVVMLRCVQMRPSLIQINSLELLPWAAITRRVTGIPIIYDSNEDYAGYMLLKAWLPAPTRRPLAWLVARLEPWIAGRLDATVVADSSTAQRFYGTSKRVLVIHNFPWRSFADQEPEAATELRYDVLYHGTLPAYHVDAIVGTAKVLKDRGLAVRWCLAAREFDEKEQRDLEARLSIENLRDDFTLFFNLPFSEIPDLLSQSRLGFIPLPDVEKFRKNLPRKVFEFMSFGRAVVASDLPPMRRLLGESGCCILARPGDIEEYAKGLERLLGDPELAGEMGRRGRELIRSSMNAEHELGPYLELCRELSVAARRS